MTQARQGGWSYDPDQALWVSPGARWLARRGTNGRWSLWLMPSDSATIASARLVRDDLKTFAYARQVAAEQDAGLR